MCDESAIKEISEELGVKPLRISASSVLATSRDRLYWCNSTWLTQEEEEVNDTNPLFTVVKLRKNNDRLDILDEGSQFHKDSSGRLLCISGYR
eukprot:2957504-Heterocapsa_arctica.AAC.1